MLCTRNPLPALAIWLDWPILDWPIKVPRLQILACRAHTLLPFDKITFKENL
jgi:hypothetical protein